MTSPASTLIGVTLVLVGLVGILVVAVIRLRSSASRDARRGREVSEEAFMATAIQEALASRAPTPAAPARASSADTALVASLPVGVLVVRQGSIVSRANPAVARVLHLPSLPVLPARLADLGAPEGLAAAVGRAATSAETATTRLQLPGPEGASYVVGVVATPMPPEPETAPGVVVVLTDLTESERRDALERRRESMAHTSQLASSLSHELANSLTGVHGYARMIDARPLTAADRASLTALQKETELLSETIEGFRRVTRSLDLAPERFPVRWLVEDAARHVVAELQVSADAIRVHTPEGLEIDGDRILLEDALMHVLRNAIEACTDAGIPPDVQLTGHASSRGAAVTLIVEDNGPGAPEPERARLFEPFFTTKPGRAGLGLARARHIVYSHDGSIEAVPSERGLTVTMTLPVADSAPSASRTR